MEINLDVLETCLVLVVGLNLETVINNFLPSRSNLNRAVIRAAMGHGKYISMAPACRPSPALPGPAHSALGHSRPRLFFPPLEITPHLALLTGPTQSALNFIGKIQPHF